MIAFEGMSTMIIHTAVKLVSCNVGDLTVVGGTAAVFSVGKSPFNTSSWTIGSELTQFDTDAYAIAKTVEVMSAFYTEEVPPPDNIF